MLLPSLQVPKEKKKSSSLVVLSVYTHSQETLQRHIFYRLIWSCFHSSSQAITLVMVSVQDKKAHPSKPSLAPHWCVSRHFSAEFALTAAAGWYIYAACDHLGLPPPPQVFQHSWCRQIMPIMHHYYLCPFKMFCWEFSQRQGSSLNAPQISYCAENLLFLSNPQSYLRAQIPISKFFWSVFWNTDSLTKIQLLF